MSQTNNSEKLKSQQPSTGPSPAVKYGADWVWDGEYGRMRLKELDDARQRAMAEAAMHPPGWLPPNVF